VSGKVSGFDKFPNVQKVSVSVDLAGAAVPVGTLAWSTKEKRSYFEYDRGFIDRGLPISPFKLPLKPGAQPSPHIPFDGLHGLFNDSLPDGWGRLLLDRRLRRRNLNKDELTPVDRLTFVGGRGMGALRYQPENILRDPQAGEVDLDWFAAQAESAQAEFGEADIDRLHELQGSSAGARPKIMIGRDETTGRMVADVGQGLPEDFEPWLIKFRSRGIDHPEAGPEEYAYSLMAKACGIEMPETKLLRGETAKYFAVRRFDRPSGGGVHVHTASGLLELDHAVPEIDYEALLNLTRVLTRNDIHVQQMFRRMVFNVLARNRDDHTKNHAFQMTASGEWCPTPAYDLTLSGGKGGEHSLAVAGEGASPGFKDVMRVAQACSVRKGDAEEIFQEVKDAVDGWPAQAEAGGLSGQRMEEVDYLLNRRGPQPKTEIKVARAPSSA
jgi:serine/threonine-protein kinase HipA